MTLHNKAAKTECLLLLLRVWLMQLATIDPCLYLIHQTIQYWQHRCINSDKFHILFYRTCSLKALNKSAAISVHNLYNTSSLVHTKNVCVYLCYVNGTDFNGTI